MYGRCWHPTGVTVEWRPYCDGQWVWTDCGWYWQSDEPWAWACYHYGRWASDSDFGWVWVPDIEWAPAWVYWRTGGGFIGWAPCPPAGFTIEPRFFAFVDVGRFHDHVRPRTVIVNDTAIINKTTVINNISHETRTIAGGPREVVVNEGPGVEVVQRATGKRVRVVPIQYAARRTSAPSALVNKPGQSSSQQKPPASLPKEEPPPGATLKPPAKTIPPNTPPSKDRTVTPGERRHGGRIGPPGGPAHPPASPPAKPAEPARGNGDQSQQKDKGQGHDKDKP